MTPRLSEGEGKHVYYISGIPYAGKTTTIERLSTRYDVGRIPEFFATPPDFFVKVKPYSPFWVKRLVLDWSFVQNVQKNYELKRDPHRDVLCDRSPLDFVAFSRLHGERAFERYEAALRAVDWLDGTIVRLTCDTGTMVERMMDRDGIDASEVDEIVDDYLEPLDGVFRDVHGSVDTVTIDTSDLGVEEMVSEVASVLGNDPPVVDVDSHVRNAYSGERRRTTP